MGFIELQVTRNFNVDLTLIDEERPCQIKEDDVGANWKNEEYELCENERDTPRPPEEETNDVEYAHPQTWT